MIVLVCLALAAGALLPIQAGLNAQLRTVVGHPVAATLVSVLVSSLAAAVVLVIGRIPLPLAAAWTRAPWWVWLGGLCGVGYVFTSTVLAPRLGAATLIASLVTGQLLAALVLDQFGWIGFATHPITAARLLGAMLLVGGVMLIRS